MREFSKFAVHKIVKEYGFTPAEKRRARLMMQRRGFSWKGAREAVAIANGAHAHTNLMLAELEAEYKAPSGDIK